jgi:hypothetical protein
LSVDEGGARTDVGEIDKLAGVGPNPEIFPPKALSSNRREPGACNWMIQAHTLLARWISTIPLPTVRPPGFLHGGDIDNAIVAHAGVVADQLNRKWSLNRHSCQT